MLETIVAVVVPEPLLKETAVAPARPLPARVTLAPAIADAGVKPVSLGSTVKSPPLSVIPPAFVTETLPVVAAMGTVARSDVGERMLNAATTPLNLTAVVPVKVLPVSVTTVPAGP